MGLKPGLIREWVRLSIDICQLAAWIFLLVELTTNYQESHNEFSS